MMENREAKNSQLPIGYKQTEVGVIPDDWEVKTLGDVVTFQGGSQPPLTTFIPVIREGYIRLLQIRDYKTDKYETFIPLNLARKFCNKEDIMIGRYGPPIFQILRGLEGAYNVALMKAIPTKEVFKEFVYYFLKQDSLFNFIEKLSQRSSGQTGVDLQQLRLYPIALPKLAEQTAIATALSDADALISSLEKLISKKRNIKQGAMQKLMQPKEGWVVKKLGEIGEYFSGGTPNTSMTNYYGGEISWITSGDLNMKMICEVEGKITKEGLQNSSSKMIQEDTLLIALYGATAGVTAISKINAAINQAVLAIVLHENYSTLFLYYTLSYLKDWIIFTYTQGGQPNLSGSIIKSIEMSFPKFQEQVRIAAILTDMDNEINVLEKKLEKYRKVKLGMMQNLLTGKIRLV